MCSGGELIKPCIFLGSSRKALERFPPIVRLRFGHALYEAQLGGEPVSAKALHGFCGRGVLELIEEFDGNAYRAVYTIRFVQVVYVLHAFQKKSKVGIATPKHEVELIKARLREAEADHRVRFKE